MLILACDTSGPALSAAVWRDGALLAETTQKTARPHSTALLPVLADLLRQVGIAIPAVDAYACTIGPGSFTGIRIAVSTVKAMAYAAGKPAIGVSTLEAMAWPYARCRGQVVCPILDARNRRLFAAAWLEGREVVPEANWLTADYRNALQALAQNQAAGGAAPAFLVTGYCPSDLAPDTADPGWTTSCAPACAGLPRAAAVAEIAEIRLSAGETGLPQQLMPRYLSLSQAERRLAADHD